MTGKTPAPHKGASQKSRTAKRQPKPDRTADFVNLFNDVTRFALHPDFRVNHPSLDLDLTVTAVALGDDGRVVFDCTAGDGTGGFWQYPFHELWPAGLATEATREMSRVLARAVTEDIVAQLIDRGELRKPDPADLPAMRVDECEQIVDGPQSETEHHLGVHPEYVMQPNAETIAIPGLPDEEK